MNTIVALATPAGKGGISIIRISGPNSYGLLAKLTRRSEILEPRKMYLREIFLDDLTEKCLVVFFASPFSFTGEDVVEIQSHGGFLLSEKIIEETIKHGAQMATPGEFSKRAYINGKMSLDQAEGIVDLINAETDMQLKAGSNLMIGKLTEVVNKLQNELTEALAEIEAKLDYPEYDFSEMESTNINSKLNLIADNLAQIINNGKQGRIIKNGVKVAIAGAPNVGKSSLLNALTNSERAIVTDIAGTTRDIIEAEYEYKGIIFRLIDTAGIHESTDIVEKIGIERAKNAIMEADLVLQITDEENVEPLKIKKNSIKIVNKIDLLSKDHKKSKNFMYISAKTGKNIENLKEEIFKQTVKNDLRQDTLYLSNERQLNCIKDALNHIKNAKKLIEEEKTMDLVSLELKSAWNSLGEITGKTSNELVLDKIFSKYCLGK